MTLTTLTSSSRPSILIVGASSGIGRAVARLFLSRGYRVGLAARRLDLLEELVKDYPSQAFCAAIDVTDEKESILPLVERMGGMDIYLHVAGVGKMNPALEAEAEKQTAATNVAGFTRCIGAAFRYFEERGGGQIAAISSIAGTKGLGVAPAYSASKAYQTTYLEALSQLSAAKKLRITVTDIRPGFVRTDFLSHDRSYPMMMEVEEVAKAVVRSIEKKESVRIVNGKFRLLVGLWQLIPSFLWRKMKVGL